MKKLSILIITLLSLNLAKAQSFFAEPYLGIHLFTSTNFDQSRDATGSSGFSLGARGGMVLEKVLFGLDLHHIDGKEKYDGGEPQNRKYNLNEVGFFFGYRLLEPLSILATYYFTSTVSIDPQLSSVKKYGSGQGFRFGARYSFPGILSLALEYRRVSYDKEVLEDDQSRAIQKSKVISSLMFTLGYPISFE